MYEKIMIWRLKIEVAWVLIWFVIRHPELVWEALVEAYEGEQTRS